MAGKITKALEVSTCEPIKSDLCSGKGLYNTTGMPNFAGIFKHFLTRPAMLISYLIYPYHV